jgi:hypothetical protein
MQKLVGLGLFAVALTIGVGCTVDSEQAVPEQAESSEDALKAFGCQYRGPGCEKAACAETGDAVHTGHCPSDHNSGWGCKIGKITYCERVLFGHIAVNPNQPPKFGDPPPTNIPRLPIGTPRTVPSRGDGSFPDIDPCAFGLCD